MFRPHFMRRIVFGVTALIFLLCQNAALAAACQAIALPTEVTEIQAPCHDHLHTDDAIINASCQPRCTTQAATAKPLNLNIAAVADLPVGTLEIDLAPANTRRTVAENSPSDRAQPPPLTRLYCRMRN